MHTAAETQCNKMQYRVKIHSLRIYWPADLLNCWLMSHLSAPTLTSSNDLSNESLFFTCTDLLQWLVQWVTFLHLHWSAAMTRLQWVTFLHLYWPAAMTRPMSHFSSPALTSCNEFLFFTCTDQLQWVSFLHLHWPAAMTRQINHFSSPALISCNESLFFTCTDQLQWVTFLQNVPEHMTLIWLPNQLLSLWDNKVNVSICGGQGRGRVNGCVEDSEDVG